MGLLMSATEREIQRAAVAALRKLNYMVIVTSTYRSVRNTRGTPDLFVFRRGYGYPHDPGRWVGIEVKSGTGPLTAEQQALVDAGMVTVCRSVEDAIDAVR